MLEPYRKLLEDVYLDDMPLARLVDESDLLVHVKGQAADAPTPKLTLLTKLMGEFRDAVGDLARAVTGTDVFRLPTEFELRFAWRPLALCAGNALGGQSQLPTERPYVSVHGAQHQFAVAGLESSDSLLGDVEFSRHLDLGHVGGASDRSQERAE
jgi:hypothetical protein